VSDADFWSLKWTETVFIFHECLCVSYDYVRGWCRFVSVNIISTCSQLLDLDTLAAFCELRAADSPCFLGGLFVVVVAIVNAINLLKRYICTYHNIRPHTIPHSESHLEKRYMHN
jgi:hypothetical protein